MLVVTPAGEIDTTLGAAVAPACTALGAVAVADGCFSAPDEQPVIADATPSAATVPQLRGRDGRHRTR